MERIDVRIESGGRKSGGRYMKEPRAHLYGVFACVRACDRYKCCTCELPAGVRALDHAPTRNVVSNLKSLRVLTQDHSSFFCVCMHPVERDADHHLAGRFKNGPCSSVLGVLLPYAEPYMGARGHKIKKQGHRYKEGTARPP